jgi:hypothetical protein
MVRRLGAMLGIIVIIGLALMLMWRVYLHHNQIRTTDEESILALLSPSTVDSSVASPCNDKRLILA